MSDDAEIVSKSNAKNLDKIYAVVFLIIGCVITGGITKIGEVIEDQTDLKSVVYGVQGSEGLVKQAKNTWGHIDILQKSNATLKLEISNLRTEVLGKIKDNKIDELTYRWHQAQANKCNHNLQ